MAVIALTSLVVLFAVVAAQEFDPMYIEAPEVSYQETLTAASFVHKYNFDIAGSILGFPTSRVDMNGFIGTAQYDVAMFRGIKYATAQRFGPPKMVEVEEDAHVDATEFGPSCPQPSEDYFMNEDGRYSEDCLFLDVYVPLRRTVVVTREPRDYDPNEYYWKPNARYSLYRDLPILISIQGEDFTYVESSKVNGRLLALHGSAIVVVVNYRPGVLGFLSSGDGHIKGNFGLRDQKVAIEWVKKYAKKFGGDASSITLLGYSSGAESVAAQMYDPTNTKHFFHRVILQSGVTKHGTQFYNGGKAETAVQKHVMNGIASNLECDGDKIECLKTADVKQLVRAAGVIGCERGDNRTFGPVKDDKFDIDSADIGQYEVMIGVVENEAGNWFRAMPDKHTLHDVVSRLFASNSFFHGSPDRLATFLNFEYMDRPEADTASDIGRAYVKLLTDYNYVAPALSFANKVSEAGGKTYVYQFSANVPEMAPRKAHFLEGRPLHGDDQNFLFGLPLMLTDLFTNSARNVSAQYIRMISNFAHTGNPNNGPTDKPVSLPPWNPYDSDYMGTYIIGDDMEMKYGKFKRTLAVWNEAVSYLMSDGVCEIEKPIEPEPPKKSTCDNSCQRYARWEKSYQAWKSDIPEWRKRLETVSATLDMQECSNE